MIFQYLICFVRTKEQTCSEHNLSGKWSAMRPIEIYCFIARVWPQWARPRLWLDRRAEKWPLIGQCWPCLVTVTVVMCPVSRMSRGHKHYCHDKSQNSDTGDKTCRKHPLCIVRVWEKWFGFDSDFRAGNVIASNWNISSLLCHNTHCVTSGDSL